MFKHGLLLLALSCAGATPPANAADNHPLDPSYTVKMSQLRGGYFDLPNNFDKNNDGLIYEDEYCAVAGDDPPSIKSVRRNFVKWPA